MSEDFNYADEDICSLYRQAKNKKWQIGILKDLTLKSTKEIIKILEDGGCIELTDERKAKVLEEYKKGLSDASIARATGIAQSQVSTFLRGQSLPPNGKPWGGKKIENKTEIKEEKEVSTTALEKLKTMGLALDSIQANQEVKETVQAVSAEELPVDVQELKAEAEQVIKQRPRLSEYEANLTDEAYLKLAILTLEILKGIWG